MDGWMGLRVIAFASSSGYLLALHLSYTHPCKHRVQDVPVNTPQVPQVVYIFSYISICHFITCRFINIYLDQ